MIAVGERLRWLGTDRLTWRDLLVIVKHAPPQGALHRSVDPEGAGWTVEAYLTAALVDATNAANWQRAGDKHAKRPDPIPRPGQPRRPVRRGRNLTQAALAQRNAVAPAD